MRRLTVKLRLFVKTLYTTAVILLAISLGPAGTFGQQSEASKVANATQAAEVEQAIRNFYKAFVQGDQMGT